MYICVSITLTHIKQVAATEAIVRYHHKKKERKLICRHKTITSIKNDISTRAFTSKCCKHATIRFAIFSAGSSTFKSLETGQPVLVKLGNAKLH